MKLKDQVLSIEQVQELQELGFDVEKHASMCWISGRLFVKNDETTRVLCLTEKYIPTLTIGDIINILPFGIDGYHFLSINSEYCRYSISGYLDTIFFTHEKEIINNLFNTLIWCIKEKYINLK